MAFLSFNNLKDLLTSLAVEKERDTERAFAVEALVYAYGVVDAANRFREVLQHTRGVKKKNTAFQLFMRKTKEVESLRDVIQHLNEKITNIGNQQSAALGTITWLGPSPNEESPPSSWVIQPGSFYPQQKTIGPNVDLQAKNPSGEISQIHIVTSGVRVDLCDTVERIRVMITSLEPSIRSHSAENELMGSDMLMRVELKPVPNDSSALDGK